jgi:hypothetical protein
MPEGASVYAEEGTAAHEYAELELSHRLGKVTRAAYSRRLKAVKAGAHWSAEMERHIGDYVAQVLELVAALGASGLKPYVDLERRVDFSRFVPEGYGTADVVVLAGGVLHVIDLKYGKGVPVAAEGNPQLMLYAVGAVEGYGILFDFADVEMTIMQPRLGATSGFSLSREELLAWASDYVAPRAGLAAAGEGEYAPSDGACRFCRARPVCRARADAALAAAREDFALPPALSVEEVAGLLPRLPGVEAWAKDVQEWALGQARDNGVAFAGYKLVEGRSVRRIPDAFAAETVLKDAGYPKRDYLKPTELKGVTDLERLLGKPRFAEMLGGLVVRPPGKPVLVPDSDRRPALGSAQGAAEDFKD